MNQILYSLIGYLLLPFMLLRLIIKNLKTPVHKQRIGERLGFINAIQGNTIWVHCVSVGEFMAAISLIDALIAGYPTHKILITSTTKTGSNAIIEHYQNRVLHYYFPFDVDFIIRRYVKKVAPKICLLLETEIWPNLISELHKNGIPTLLISARLSQKSLAKYQKMPAFSRQILNKLTLIAAQNQKSAERFKKLGTADDKIIITGNIKFDQNPKLNSAVSKQLKNIVCKRKVVVFASTHKGEERAIIDAYSKNPVAAILLIIPRHPERFDEVFKLAQKRNFSISKRSENQPCIDCKILLGDSMGEMMDYFAIADIVFMGGSLSKTGGHNMLEPAALAKPILFGENVFNFSEISADLLAQNAAIQVQNADDLLIKASMLLNDREKAKTLGNNAKKHLQSKQGALNNTLQKIQLFC